MHKIICPYCFAEMDDTQVHFRSEKINYGENPYIPPEYDDIDDFEARYSGDNKKTIITKYNDWNFFKAKTDYKYNEFWKKYAGTTEYDPSSELLNIKPYERKVIDPNYQPHQRYLKKKDDSYLIKDINGMVSQIELYDGTKCGRRVCKECHNPLPVSYGVNNVKFVSVIGIVGSGKTVYLSQLINGIKEYSLKVGLTAIPNSASILAFNDKNKIKEGYPLPASTIAGKFEQPLFFEITKRDSDGTVTNYTLVLYDIAGEILDQEKGYSLERYAKFIEKSDGIIVLLDPMQFKSVTNVMENDDKKKGTTAVLDAVNNFVHKKANGICDIPTAVCIPKFDTADVKSAFGETITELVLEDVQGIDASNGKYKAVFNASQYNSLSKALWNSLKANEKDLHTRLVDKFDAFNYFAFTALGCDIEVKNKDNEIKIPIGPIVPKRIEEPLLWLFSKFNFIGVNEDIFNPKYGEIKCPECESTKTVRCEGRKEEVIPNRNRVLRFLGVGEETKTYNCICKNCQHKWYQE